LDSLRRDPPPRTVRPYAARAEPGAPRHLASGQPVTGRRRIYEAFPPELIVRESDSEMLIKLVNGSIWRHQRHIQIFQSATVTLTGSPAFFDRIRVRQYRRFVDV
jgi:hypothetical protein